MEGGLHLRALVYCVSISFRGCARVYCGLLDLIIGVVSLMRMRRESWRILRSGLRCAGCVWLIRLAVRVVVRYPCARV